YVAPQRVSQNMYLINSMSGAIQQTIPLLDPVGNGSDALNALTSDPSGAVLLGVQSDRSSSPTTSFLVSIDKSGIVTSRGALPGDMGALALQLQPSLPLTPTVTATPGQANGVLWGATGSNGVPGVLYRIDPNTAAATQVGPIILGGQPISLTGLA